MSVECGEVFVDVSHEADCTCQCGHIQRPPCSHCTECTEVCTLPAGHQDEEPCG